MPLNIVAEFEGKLTCALENDMRNLKNFDRLKNSNFILKRIMIESNKNKNKKRPD